MSNIVFEKNKYSTDSIIPKIWGNCFLRVSLLIYIVKNKMIKIFLYLLLVLQLNNMFENLNYQFSLSKTLVILTKKEIFYKFLQIK